MLQILQTYKRRLSNLSQKNRSLKLIKLVNKKDIDLVNFAFENGLSAPQLLDQLLAQKSITLLPNLSSRSENTNLLDKKLTQIQREVNATYLESGVYNLFVGYPFVEGKFQDESIARCPLVLFPCKLTRNQSNTKRWELVISEENGPIWNKTFFYAYQLYQQHKIDENFWMEDISPFPDTQSYLNWLYTTLKKYEIELNFNSDLFNIPIQPFTDYTAQTINNIGLGLIKLQPNAILGVFPQSDSSLTEDYETLEADSQKFGLENLLKEEIRTVENQDIAVHSVIPIDATQEQVVQTARQGVSLVVEGPPGSGKSQMIINLVADNLARGKRVLIVSQKRAALDVVYKRLSSLGLSQFAYLVHDIREDRPKIFGQLLNWCNQLIDNTYPKSNYNQKEYETCMNKLAESEFFFESLYNALSKPNDVGISIHELYLLTQPHFDRIPSKDIPNTLDLNTLNNFIQRLKEIYAYKDLLDSKHPWFHRHSFARLNFSDKSESLQKLSQLPTELQTLQNKVDSIAYSGYYVLEIVNLDEIIADYKNMDKHLQNPSFVKNYALYKNLAPNNPHPLTPSPKEEGGQKNYPSPSERGSGGEGFLSTLNHFESLLEPLKSMVYLKNLPINQTQELETAIAIYHQWKDSFFRFLSGAWWECKGIIQKFIGENDLDEEIVKRLEEQIKILKEVHQFTQNQKVGDLNFFENLPTFTPENLPLKWIEDKKTDGEIIKAFDDRMSFPTLKPQFENNSLDKTHWQASISYFNLVESVKKDWEEQIATWKEFLHHRQVEPLLHQILSNKPYQEMCTALSQSLTSDFENLRALDVIMGGMEMEEQLFFNKISTEIPFHESQDIYNQYLEKIRQSTYLKWIEIIEKAYPELMEVSSRTFSQKMDQFAANYNESEKQTLNFILGQLEFAIENERKKEGNLQNFKEIQYQVKKKRSIWPIRKLIQEYWNKGLKTMTPIWMASPEAASALFPMEKDFFDLIIFDEASQCYIEKALPVLVRGKQSVIVGDEKQLSPYNLYEVRAEMGEEFDETQTAILTEIESVLGFASHRFPQIPLSWHYRSSEEALVNFSNHAFYKGNLKMMPSAVKNKTYSPVLEWVKVSGTWQNNSNEIEADKVLNLIEEWIQKPENPTLGVVTFNFFQQELIWDKIDERLAKLTDEKNLDLLSKWQKAISRMDQGEDNSLFVKNIENVQGDERDIIIFSIGYAPNKDGKMSFNFGSLNQAGGPNRLNVAITRAKKKIYLVTSIEPEELKVDDAKNEGPKLLKGYLQYVRNYSLNPHLTASKNPHPLTPSPKGEGEQITPPLQLERGPGGEDQNVHPIAFWLAEKLNALGYETIANYGDTNYKIDLAVKYRSPDKKVFKSISDAEIFIDDSNYYDEYKNDFILAIECNSKFYFSGINPREREVYRPKLLHDKGWKTYRVWNRNFWLNPEEELKRILEILG